MHVNWFAALAISFAFGSPIDNSVIVASDTASAFSFHATGTYFRSEDPARDEQVPLRESPEHVQSA
jgi:hypothetical protein